MPDWLVITIAAGGAVGVNGLLARVFWAALLASVRKEVEQRAPTKEGFAAMQERIAQAENLLGQLRSRSHDTSDALARLQTRSEVQWERVVDALEGVQEELKSLRAMMGEQAPIMARTIARLDAIEARAGGD